MSQIPDDNGTIIEFLLGEKSFDGMWFGERRPGEKPQWWWRKHLREHINSLSSEEINRRGVRWIRCKDKTPDRPNAAYRDKWESPYQENHWEWIYFNGAVRDGEIVDSDSGVIINPDTVEWLDESEHSTPDAHISMQQEIERLNDENRHFSAQITWLDDKYAISEYREVIKKLIEFVSEVAKGQKGELKSEFINRITSRAKDLLR